MSPRQDLHCIRSWPGLLVPCVIITAVLSLPSIEGAKSEKGHKSDRDIKVLTTSVFDKGVKKHKRALVAFCAPCLTGDTGQKAPWCGACTQLDTEFAKADKMLMDQHLKTRLLRVDVMDEKSTGLAIRFGVNLRDVQKKEDMPKLPQLFYFVGGARFSNYTLPPSAESIVEWLRANEQQDISELPEEDVEKFTNSTKHGDFAIVAHVKPKSKRANAFWDAVNAGILGYTHSRIKIAAAPLPAKADANRDATLTLWRPGFSGEKPDSKQAKFTGSWSAAEIIKWVKKRTYPSISVGVSGQKYSWEAINKAGWEASVVAVLPLKGAVAPTFDLLRPLAKKYANWRFALSSVKGLDPAASSLLDVKDGSTPIITVFYEARRYVLSGSEKVSDVAQVEAFLSTVKGRTAQPQFRSQAALASYMDEGVTILTGDTFEVHAFDESKDVLVAFLSPDCNSCKAVDLIFKEVAKKAHTKGWDLMGLVVAKMDSSENECREDVSPGYPKIVLYPAVKADRKIEMRQVRATGAKMSLESMTKFVLDNARTLKGVKEEL